MPFPVAAVAIGAAVRGVAGVAARGAARSVMTGARFGSRGAANAARMSGRAALIGSNISSAQFSNSPDANLSNPGTAITEPLRFGADMRVGTEK
jgi:hypothetical protein